jgi:hypothetical protein
MICGLDIYSSPSMNRKSVVGFCASYNKYITKYWSKSLVQDAEQRVDLQPLMFKALRKFHKLNYCMPKRVIFFRGSRGYSDSELPQIEAAFKELGLTDKVSLVFITVQRNVNTRIFAQGELENTFKNPIPGIVVNQEITEVDSLHEFFLISTAAR